MLRMCLFSDILLSAPEDKGTNGSLSPPKVSLSSVDSGERFAVCGLRNVDTQITRLTLSREVVGREISRSYNISSHLQAPPTLSRFPRIFVFCNFDLDWRSLSCRY